MLNRVHFDGKGITPSKIVCVGRNYVDHIRELDNEIPAEPVIFIKPNSAIADEIDITGDDDIHYEGEISFLLRSGELAGVAFGLDLTKREVQAALKKKGLPWERAKAFNGSAVFSDFVGIVGPIGDLRLELHINGQLRQRAGCHLMLNPPGALLDDIQTFLALEDGDILMSGTPSGVGPIREGDRFEGKIFSQDRLLVEGSWFVAKKAR